MSQITQISQSISIGKFSHFLNDSQFSRACNRAKFGRLMSSKIAKISDYIFFTLFISLFCHFQTHNTNQTSSAIPAPVESTPNVKSSTISRPARAFHRTREIPSLAVDTSVTSIMIDCSPQEMCSNFKCRI